MSIAWEHFTPYSALGGGALIGLAAALMVLLEGRIAGISGILGGLLQRPLPPDARWRVAFIAGLLLAPLLYGTVFHLPAIHLSASPLLIIVAGLLVGFGSRLGSGCTSGHGVCGLSRLSPRSLAATLVFMAGGMLTVGLIRHGLGN